MHIIRVHRTVSAGKKASSVEMWSNEHMATTSNMTLEVWIDLTMAYVAASLIVLTFIHCNMHNTSSTHAGVI